MTKVQLGVELFNGQGIETVPEAAHYSDQMFASASRGERGRGRAASAGFCLTLSVDLIDVE